MSVQPPTHEEIQIDGDEVEEEEEDEEEEDEAEDEDFEDIEEVTHGRSPGRGLTLKTLVKEGVLQPGEGHMTINYLVRLPYRDSSSCPCDFDKGFSMYYFCAGLPLAHNSGGYIGEHTHQPDKAHSIR